MAPAINTSIELRDLSISSEMLLDFEYPGLQEDSAICIGLSIDWRHTQTLHDYCIRHTHVDEHARADRFLKKDDSLRHLLGRALLRRLAIRYGQMVPNQPIPSNEWGKPQPVAFPLCCNISHSGNQVWAAIANFPNAGIDVESAIAPSGYRDIIKNFHPHETAALFSVPDTQDAVMRCWTRKEAVCKAIGMGFGIPLSDYAVDCGIKPDSWLRVSPNLSQSQDWTTIDLPVEKDFVGALAVEGRCTKVTIIRLNII